MRVDFWRSTLISRSLEKHPDQRNFFTQTLWIPMECYSPVPCSIPMPICHEMRTKYKIPKPLRFGTTLFDYVGSILGDNPFSYTSQGTIDIMQEGKFAANKTFWQYPNDYITIKNNKENYNDRPIPTIMVVGVFDNPIDVLDLNCQLQGCDFWDSEYPATNDIIQMIIQYILQVDYGVRTDKDVSNPPEIEVNPLQPRNE